MSSAAALVTCLLQAASLEGDLALRADQRTSAVTPRGGETEERVSVSLAPRAGVGLDATPVRASVAYAPRLWTSDVASHPELLATHLVETRLEARPEGNWRVGASGAALRGRTDPVMDALSAAQTAMAARAAPPGGGQLATTRSIRYEEIGAGADAEVSLGSRTQLSVSGGGRLGRSTAPEDRALMPVQRSASVGAVVGWLATDRDGVRVSATASQAWTDTVAGLVRTGSTTALLTWRRTVTPLVQAWAGAGGTLSGGGLLWSLRDPSVYAAGEAGVARGGESLAVTLELTGRLTTYVDRFTGAEHPMATATGTLEWRIREHLSLLGSISGGARTDGDTLLGRGDARIVWRVREDTSVEAGGAVRTQRERRPELPSFVEAVAFAALVYTPARLSRAIGQPQ